MNQHSVSGYVLARKNIGEADRLIRFYCHDGKTVFIANGVRKVGSRRAGHLEPFALVRLQLHKGKSLAILTQTQTIQPSPINTGDLQEVAVGFALIELVDRLLEENQVVDGLIEVLSELFGCIAQHSSPSLVMSYLCLYLLHAIGSQPEFVDESSAAEYFFDYQEGRVVKVRSEHGTTVSQDVLKLWRLLGHLKPNQLTRLKADDQVFTESWQLLAKYIEYHFHIRLRSTELL
jgi:DNA repair protein RecO (recombination protein O)